MDTNDHESGKLLHAELVYRVAGCAMEVLNELGHGLHEKPYENALAIELRLRGIAFEKQARFPVMYKGNVVAEFVPDLLIDRVLVVDTKVIEQITNHERGQMLNYLRITKCRVGIVLNMHRPKLEWERIVL